MNKKLPKIYKGNDYSHVNNNKKIFHLSEKKYNYDNGKLNSCNIDNYIINSLVLIETYDNKIIKTKIVSKRTNYIVTSENKIIKTDEIKSIKSIE